MRYTISLLKCLDRKQLFSFLRKTNSGLSIHQVLDKINDIDNTPILLEDLSSEVFDQYLLQLANCTYLKIEAFDNALSYSNSYNEDYLTAKSWYDTLSKTEQNYINILINRKSCGPTA